MYKAILIEDELPARQVLTNYVKKYFSESILIVNLFDSVNESLDFLANNTIEIIFLDVHLKDGKGTDILNLIDTNKYKIVFTTAFNNYSLEAFKHKAFGYLLKPINPIDFKEIIQRLLNDLKFNSLSKNENKNIKIPTATGYIWVNVNDIIRCQGSNNYTEIYLYNSAEKYILSRTLKHVETNILDSKIFFRCHQSHLININHLAKKEIKENQLTLKNGDKVPISRSRKIEFETKIINTSSIS